MKTAKTVLMVIVAGDDIVPIRRDLSHGVAVTRFAYPLALALSAERRVLLVDLVSNDACLELGFQSGAGVLGIAGGQMSPAETVLATASPQVDLLPLGAVECEQQSVRLLDSVRLATAIITFARVYDLVLITAGFDDVLEKSRLARAIDLAVLAVPAATNSADEIKAACTRLELIGIKPEGILLLDNPSRALSGSTD